MKTLTIEQASGDLQCLLDEAAASHEPIRIIGARTASVLVSEDHWRAVQETLHLLSSPGMRESIREGLAAPLAECADEPGW